MSGINNLFPTYDLLSFFFLITHEENNDELPHWLPLVCGAITTTTRRKCASSVELVFEIDDCTQHRDKGMGILPATATTFSYALKKGNVVTTTVFSLTNMYDPHPKKKKNTLKPLTERAPQCASNHGGINLK